MSWVVFFFPFVADCSYLLGTLHNRRLGEIVGRAMGSTSAPDTLIIFMDGFAPYSISLNKSAYHAITYYCMRHFFEHPREMKRAACESGAVSTLLHYRHLPPLASYAFNRHALDSRPVPDSQ